MIATLYSKRLFYFTHCQSGVSFVCALTQPPLPLFTAISSCHQRVTRLQQLLLLYTVQCVLDHPNPDFPYPDIWTLGHVAKFSAPAGKIRCSHWRFAPGESKAAVRTTFSNNTTLFSCSTRNLDMIYNVRAS